MEIRVNNSNTRNERIMNQVRGKAMVSFLKAHTKKQMEFIERRSRASTLRSYDNYSEERKKRFCAFTQYVKINNLFLIMFLQHLEKDSEAFIKFKDQLLQEMKSQGHNVIEEYERCEKEGDYLDMCSQISTGLKTAELICKYER